MSWISNKNLNRENPRLHGFTEECIQALKEELTPILKFFQIFEEKEILADLFYKDIITLIPESEKYCRENYGPIFQMNIDIEF